MPALCPDCRQPYDQDAPPMRYGQVTICAECFYEREDRAIDAAVFDNGQVVEFEGNDY